MLEIKLRMQVMRPLASGEHGALSFVGGVCWGVTAGNASHNASNARGVTAGKMGRNSSEINGEKRRMSFVTRKCRSSKQLRYIRQ